MEDWLRRWARHELSPSSQQSKYIHFWLLWRRLQQSRSDSNILHPHGGPTCASIELCNKLLGWSFPSNSSSYCSCHWASDIRIASWYSTWKHLMIWGIKSNHSETFLSARYTARTCLVGNQTWETKLGGHVSPMALFSFLLANCREYNKGYKRKSKWTVPTPCVSAFCHTQLRWSTCREAFLALNFRGFNPPSGGSGRQYFMNGA